jgi:acyl-CoA thioesterase FadM
MMHASRPASYFEDGGLAWLEEACGGYPTLRADGVDLVLVEVTTRYLAPVRLGEIVDVEARAVDRGRTSFQLQLDLVVDGEVRVSATNTYVVVADGVATPIPERLAAALAPGG